MPNPFKSNKPDDVRSALSGVVNKPSNGNGNKGNAPLYQGKSKGKGPKPFSGGAPGNSFSHRRDGRGALSNPGLGVNPIDEKRKNKFLPPSLANKSSDDGDKQNRMVARYKGGNE